MSPKFAVILLFSLPLLLLTACVDSSSGGDLVREVDLNVAGLYQGNDGNNLVSQNTGPEVTQMNITQSGSELTAIDNNGNIYRGNVTAVSGDSAGFIIRGVSGGGVDVTMNGAFNVSGDTSEISGRWIEPAVLASILGSSFVPGRTATNDATSTPVSVSPSANQSLAVDSSLQFSAAGGDGDFAWSISDGTIGSLSSTTGDNVTYTADAAGTQSLTLTSNGESESVSITQTESANTTALSVTPAGNRSITVPDSVSYTASGSDGTYSWSLSNSGIGTLSGTSGANVTYAGTETGTQTITVESDGNVVTRLVNQTEGATTALTISPSGTQVLTGIQSQIFTASGGTAPYSWSISDANIGTLSGTTGATTTYTSSTIGAQSLTLTDSGGSTISVTIAQSGDTIVTPPTP